LRAIIGADYSLNHGKKDGSAEITNENARAETCGKDVIAGLLAGAEGSAAACGTEGEGRKNQAVDRS
jgi:hypothetical protein